MIRPVAVTSQALLLAVSLDMLLAEPPATLHPVTWMGHWLSLGRRRAPHGDMARLGFGTLWLALGATLSALAGTFVTRIVGEGVALWPVIAWRALSDAADQVQAALTAGNLEEARRLLSWHLVSRETATLSATDVAEAAIESVAENLTDSWVAPLLAYAVGGVPTAWAYRFLNTADAMWGYRDAEREWLGKSAARLDDLVNWLPARLTAVMLITLGGSDAARTAWRDQRYTPSPNGGWTMGAMAGALGTTLSKPGVYTLRGGTLPADAHLIGRARRLGTGVAALWTLLLLGWCRSEPHRPCRRPRAERGNS